MRPSLFLHQTRHSDGRCKLANLTLGSADVQRDQAVAAAETVALVLDDESPLPQSAGDVEELARRLRGHIGQLGAVVPPGAATVRGAQQLASAGVPDGYMPSRVHLVKLAEATQALVATVQARGVVPAKPRRGRRWWRPQLNVLRGSVFAVAFALLVLAASVPRA
ncbi:DUF6415 family natural product biosynthesis protein [Streptomyces sp. QL37]|uniref:DUF6415 family natural product biosynthesis protein n=1 Tax=Streptomyces sp. QL37 TaxID=2093747 RepID=UPI0021CB1766|nr:DUF6415 family natural product biosynthesis protein [Streptomyces sp. QL37]